MTRLADHKGTNSPTVAGDGHRTGTCVICKLGIFYGQPAVRTRGQWLGRSHQECAETLEVIR